MAESKCMICGKPVHWNGLCHAHGERWRRWGKPPLAEWVAAFLGGRLLTCVHCGKPFNGYRNRAFCSDGCKTEFKRAAALANWHARSADSKRAAAERSVELARRKRQANRRELACGVCKKPFMGFPRRKYCSKACGRLARYGYQANCRSRIAVHVAASILGETIDRDQSRHADSRPG